MGNLLVIVGPTAIGKTDVAIGLAKRFAAEVISCDSRQVYKGMDIGTGKMPGLRVKYSKHDGYWMVDGVAIWMLDVAPPAGEFSVRDYIIQARGVIRNLWKEGKKVIVVGGTGYYLKGLLEGIGNLSVGYDPKLRKELEGKSILRLQKLLGSDYPDAWARMNPSDRQNRRRLVRAVEVAEGKKSKGGDETRSMVAEVLKIGLRAPREVLNKRIDERVDKRLDLGMVEEAEYLHGQGLSFERMEGFGLEYRYLAKLLKGEVTGQEMERELKIKIHQYAKRQMTWFRKDGDISWFDVTDKGWFGKLESKVRDWYNV